MVSLNGYFGKVKGERGEVLWGNVCGVWVDGGLLCWGKIIGVVKGMGGE